jgi:hypothetical protein
VEIGSPLRQAAGEAQEASGRGRHGRVPADRSLQPRVGKIVRFERARYAFPLDRIISDRKRVPKGMKRKPVILI